MTSSTAGPMSPVSTGPVIRATAAEDPGLSPSVAPAAPTERALHDRYRPVFDRIAQGAVQRERERILPHEPIRWLKDSGFLAVRVPQEHGGDGASLPQLARLLIDLAAADPNIPQALRGHIGFVEDRLYATPAPERDRWLRRFVLGEMVGNAVTEVGTVAVGRTSTKLTRDGGRWRITGRKFYTTGSIFAEWIDATATRPDGVEVAALVANGEGVTVSDDWAGFGQRLTGSGTAVFDEAPVEAENVFVFADRFPYQTALYQTVLLAVLCGVGQAAEREAAALLNARDRVYSHGNAASARTDPQLLQVLGQVSADNFAAVAATVRAAEAVQEAANARGTAAERARNLEAEVTSAQAQVVVTRLVLGAVTHVFDALGASAVTTTHALDRHWRNARTVASHNPTVFKARIVGDWTVNGTPPPFEWSIGRGDTAPEAG